MKSRPIFYCTSFSGIGAGHRSRGPSPAECPALYSGELSRFYAPRPSPAELAADRWRRRETAHATVWDYRFASETRQQVARKRLRVGPALADESNPIGG